MQPLNEYYLWCDHRATAEAQEITALAHKENLEAIEWCGGVYSHEWGFAKLLHWLRHNPEKRAQLASAFEHCDMVAATLCGITDPRQARRSVCAMGHKWMWNPKWGGLPPQSFLSKVDPLLDGIRDKLDGEYLTSDHLAGHLAPEWAEKLGLRAGIPIPVGAFDAHWDALGAGCREGDVVNVVGTSTCIIAMAHETRLIPGVCGVVPGSVHPRYTGIEAGLSATGDIFEAIATRAGTKVADLSKGLEKYRAGQTGLLRLSWDNGDRTVLVNSELGGVTLGWNLVHTAQDELFAAIEGTAFHTRIILERMAEYGTRVERVINAGGVPQNNPVLNQVYADVLEQAGAGARRKSRPALAPASLRWSRPELFQRLKRRRRSFVRNSRCSRRGPMQSPSTRSSILCIAKCTSRSEHDPLSRPLSETFFLKCAGSPARSTERRIKGAESDRVRRQRRGRAGISPRQWPGTSEM